MKCHTCSLVSSLCLIGFWVATSQADTPRPAKAAPAAERWIKMPLLSPEAARAGVTPGGEGAQWPRGPVAISPSDPDFLLLPIDVGGLYRSLDAGKHWEIATIGWNARGANAFAIDPKNPRRVIGIGGNSMNYGETWGSCPNGIYVSDNKAASWRQVAAFYNGLASAAAFDPMSFDAKKGFCVTAYVAASGAGLLKSTDGGAHWKIINPAPPGLEADGYHPARFAVHPKRGFLYMGGKGGLFRSADGGETFEKVYASDVAGVAVSAAAPDSVWVSGAGGVAVSSDAGKTFRALPAAGIDRQNDKPVGTLAVSPVDPRRMACWIEGDNYKWVRYSSRDGGKTFAPVIIEKGLAPLPQNVRNGYFSYHPKDANIVYGLGGDWVTRSVDGGKTFRWSNNGYNAIMTGGLFNFSPFEPKTIFLGFQDYNGAFTTDGGKTWNYRDVSGKGWGGHCYGGFAPDKTLMFTGDADDWGGKRSIRLSRDRGTTWETVKGADDKPVLLSGADVSLCDPTDANILFAHDHRSTDKGKTWTPMADCDGVFTYDPVTKALLGKKGNAVMRSEDKGATWRVVSDVEGGMDDIATDAKRGRIYVASQDKLKSFQNGKWRAIETPHDQYNNVRVTTVAVDPNDPSVIYVGGPRNIYASHATVCRSTDGGETWTNLTVTAPIGNGVIDGPHEVGAIRVHPVTHEAWVAGQCYGLWRIAAPAPGTKGLSAQSASAPRAPALKPFVAVAPAPPAAATRPLSLRNADMEAGGDKPDDWNVAWTGRGTIKVLRDTVMFHGGRASLKVASEGGDAMGQTSQIIDAEAGTKVTVSGWVRSQGNVKVNVGVQPLDVGWTPLSFMQIGYVQNETGWTHFSKEVTLPAKTVRFGIALLMDGSGSANLDDVALEGATPLDPAMVPPPASQNPTVAYNGFFPDYPQAWMNFHRLFVEQAKKTPNAPIVFIGDSITQGWSGGGKAEWDKNFAPLGAVNFGIGGDKTSQILWRIEHGTLDGMTPRLIVLAIGVNNLWANDFDNEKVADGIAACVDAARAKCPKSQILVVGILPTGEKADDPLRARIKIINALSAKRFPGGTVSFTDFGDKFLAPDGTIPKETMPDHLHPNDKGYVIYADNLAPIVKKMLAEPAANK